MTAQKGASTKWTEEETNFLRNHYRVHHAYVIAEALGKTKNAIIGRANRIGLSLPYDEVFRNPYGKLMRGKQKMPKIVPDEPTSDNDYLSRNLLSIAKQRSVHLQRRKSPIIQDAFLDDLIEPLNGVGVSLWDAKINHCRWVIGDPKAMMYCGHDIHKGSSYCPTHYAITKTSSKQVKK